MIWSHVSLKWLVSVITKKFHRKVQVSEYSFYKYILKSIWRSLDPTIDLIDLIKIKTYFKYMFTYFCNSESLEVLERRAWEYLTYITLLSY